jgi:hypothetical protein
MPDDLFILFRWGLSLVVTVYATVLLLQWAWGWYLYFASGDKYASLLRRYVIVHALRLRFRAFWGDLLICLLLGVAFVCMWRAQLLLDQMNRVIQSAPISHANHQPN